jgi:hypothetical protein
MTVRAAVHRAHDGRLGRIEFGQERRDGRRGDKRQVHGCHEQAVDPGMVGHEQPGQNRRQRPTLRVGILDEPDRHVQPVELGPERGVVGTSSDEHFRHTARPQRLRETADEGAPVGHRQERLGRAHARRAAGGNDQAGDHARAFYVGEGRAVGEKVAAEGPGTPEKGRIPGRALTPARCLTSHLEVPTLAPIFKLSARSEDQSGAAEGRFDWQVVGAHPFAGRVLQAR